MRQHNLDHYVEAPDRDDSSSGGSISDDPDFNRALPSQAARLGNVDWCRCKRCTVMPAVIECVCCCDVPVIRSDKLFVTLEDDFRKLRLDTAVLRVAYIDVNVNGEDAGIEVNHK
ncbi:hypothetical protein HPB52_021176 [Rhipicephalus sanguineus]|uniref:Uncharacterized protein n=1 Tax=Rhipicephalus sanguineus TaxID=34632 RepID=A0A9D4T334_RHISA|nr:hypothetical protein HPB52_021176 [Rhipicephalus sanguineus]